MDATARFLAIVAVAAFATERVLAAAGYLMNTVRLARVRRSLARGLRARALRKLVLLVIAAVIAFIVVDRAQLRLLKLLQLNNVPEWLDASLTWLVVFSGADRVHSLLGGGGGGKDAPTVTMRVEGGEIHNVERAS
ncbi:MAG: hypothetical protein JO197_19985 [Acidobacteria bacterium]|nr:hypothetical protein [Acidobacteriota bacterium]MBV9474620.1 hypothetical protein [Acidobacteriota bacterium]